MSDYDDYELESKIEDLDKMERVLQAKQQRDLARAANNAVMAGVMDALKEAGLTEADWGRIYHADPETTLRKQREQAKRFAQKVIGKAKAGKKAEKREAQGRKASSKAETSASSRGSSEERRAACDKVLNDFFLETLRK
jgi:hypothetical protein